MLTTATPVANPINDPGLALKNGFCLGYFQGVLVSHALYHKIFDGLRATLILVDLEPADAFFCAPLSR